MLWLEKQRSYNSVWNCQFQSKKVSWNTRFHFCGIFGYFDHSPPPSRIVIRYVTVSTARHRAIRSAIHQMCGQIFNSARYAILFTCCLAVSLCYQLHTLLQPSNSQSPSQRLVQLLFEDFPERYGRVGYGRGHRSGSPLRDTPEPATATFNTGQAALARCSTTYSIIGNCSLSSPRTAPSVTIATRMRSADVTLRWYAVRNRRFRTTYRSRLQGSSSPFTLKDGTYRLSQIASTLITTQTCLIFQYSQDLIYTAEKA
jgi:hypothetical protein